MRVYLLLIIALLMLTAGLASACDGGNGAAGEGNSVGDSEDVNGAVPTKTESPAATAEAVQGTPTSFEALRDTLRDRLDAIGVNIGAVPDDVHDQILGWCHELESLAQQEVVADICEAIEDAIEQGDPGLIDLVLDQLAELEPD